MPAPAFRIVKIIALEVTISQKFSFALSERQKECTIFFDTYFPLPANGCMRPSAVAHKSEISQVETHAHTIEY